MMKYLVIVSGVLGLLAYQNCGNQVAFKDDPLAQTFATNTSVSVLECSFGTTSANSTAQMIYPSSCLLPPTLATQTPGLEINQGDLLNQSTTSPGIFLLPADDSVNGTPVARALYIEFATYVAPDTVVISAVMADGSTQELMNVCNVSTWNKGDNTSGLKRPYSDTIVQFSAILPKGTKSLKFDYTGSTTPTYLGVWNLGDFSRALASSSTNPFTSAITGSNPQMFRPVNGLPSPLNDNADPVYPSLCE